MGMPRVNLVGHVYGRLTVIAMLRVPKGLPSKCTARCTCGTIKEFTAGDIRGGGTKSCGCLRLEVLDRTTHGLKHHRGYALWYAMHARCYKPQDPDYCNYGGRGIKVCYKWHRDNRNGLRNYCSWLDQQNWVPGLSVDRRNNNRGYSPANCRMATAKEQTANSRPRRKKHDS